MAYISLYRKYRPKYFSDVVGQDVIIKILKNSINNQKINHAYIFSGPRGTGKTSVAKIFSKAVNCISPNDGDLCGKCDVCNSNFNDEIDIVEIDAASNNGVDEIREIRNNAKLMPSHLKYKVYIIDEVHMLSTSAFNALLKTLEEPPSHVIFILATTEVNKIPSTILSRCQKFDFKKISEANIENQIKKILKKENCSLDDDVIKLIAKLSNGGLRDAINLTDQLIAINKKNISTDDVYDLIGDVNDDTIFNIFDFITKSDIKNVLLIIDQLYEEGKNFVTICDRLQLLLRNIIIYNNTNNYFDKEYEKRLEKYSHIDVDKCSLASEILFNLISELKKTNNQKNLMEIYLIKLILLFKNNENNSIKENSNDIKSIKVDENENKIDTTYKKIRINNTLAEANKDFKKDLINKYDEIREFLSSKESNAIASLLLKGKPEVVSNKNILFVFKNNFEVVLFDKNIEEIQKFLKLVFNKKYSVVAVNNDDWLSIKKEYISNTKEGKKYEYLPETKVLENKKKKTTILENTIENIFGEDYTEIN